MTSQSLHKPQRTRSTVHLLWIRHQRCAVPGCGRWPCEAHHLTCAGNKARGLKAGDNLCLPLCHDHHIGQDSPHHMGDEAMWWSSHGVDPIATAAEFWRRSPANRGKQ